MARKIINFGTMFILLFAMLGCIPWPIAVEEQHALQSFHEISETVKPALVQIECIHPDTAIILMLAKLNHIKDIPPDIAKMLQIVYGTGFVIDDTGYVVTNAHVIPEGWITIVRFQNGEKHTAVAVGYDKTNDIAVAKIKVDKKLPSLKFATEEARAGDVVWMVGRTPRFDNSVKSGLVSYINRERIPGVYSMEMTMPVNKGESGSPIFNGKGEVVGVVAAYLINKNAISIGVPGKVAQNSVERIMVYLKPAGEKKTEETKDEGE